MSPSDDAIGLPADDMYYFSGEADASGTDVMLSGFVQFVLCDDFLTIHCHFRFQVSHRIPAQQTNYQGSILCTYNIGTFTIRSITVLTYCFLLLLL